MEQNNFENDIHRKLAELKIAPSDSVWTTVEKHIGKKDKKRRAIFILFFFLLCLFLGGFWFINSEKNSLKKHEPVAGVSKKDSKATNSPDSSFKQSIVATKISPKPVTMNISTKKSIIKNASIENPTFVSKRKIHSIEIKMANSKPTNNGENYFASDGKDSSLIKQPESLETKVQSAGANVQDLNKQDSFQGKSQSQKVKKETVSVNDSLIKKHPKKTQKHPWNFGITFSGGNSFTTKNHSAINNVYSDPSGNINSGIPANFYSPSEIKNSTAFMVGIFIEKNISGANKVSLGISYQYLSLVNKVGNPFYPTTANTQFSASPNNLYSSTNVNRFYRNQFHFLEIPVSIDFRINKSKSVPLFWNAGINISELISTNALQFQSNPGIYYQDNSLFNKTQFGLHTGFSVMIFAKEKNSLTVGPYFYYSPTNIANKGLYSEKHFSSIGIQAKVLFRKK
ncbi:MAG: porin family protein [Ginsengibacter sp.]